jgi:putative tricarboxylic transport membrane protein
MSGMGEGPGEVNGEKAMTMKWPYCVTGSLFLLLAIFIAVESLALRYYTPLGPGPGFFSFWLSVVLGGLTLVMIVQATFGRAEPMPDDFFADRTGYLRIGAVVLALVVTIYTFEPLGFSLTMFGVCAFLLTALGRQGRLVTLLVSLASSFGAYYVFDHWLKVPLPKGVLGF